MNLHNLWSFHGSGVPLFYFVVLNFFRVNLFWMSSSRMLPLRAAALAQWPKRAFSRCSASMVWCPSNTFWCGSGGHTGFRGPCSYYQYWVNILIKFRYSEKAMQIWNNLPLFFDIEACELATAPPKCIRGTPHHGSTASWKGSLGPLC